MSQTRNWIGWLFIAAVLAGLASFIYVFIAGLNETDPSIARANPAGIGAFVLAMVEVGLITLYFRRPDLPGLVRVFAGALGVVGGLLLNTAVPLVLRELYERPFPTTAHTVAWFVYGVHLLYALFGDGRRAAPEG